MEPNRGGREGESVRLELVRQLSQPIVCLAGTLLVIEGMIATVAVWSKMAGAQQFYCVLVMAALAAGAVGAVAWAVRGQPAPQPARTQQVEQPGAMDRMQELEAIIASADYARLLEERGRRDDPSRHLAAPRGRGQG